MALDHNLSQLIGRIYEGAFDQGSWNRAVEEIVGLTGSRYGLLAVLDTRKHDFATTSYHGRFEEKVIPEYESEIFLIDPSFDFIVANPRARFYEADLHIGTEGYLDVPFVRWCMDKSKTSHWITGYTPEDDGFTFAASFHSDEFLSPHAARQRRLLKILFEHLERAQRLAARPPDLESADKALVLLDRRGRVLSINAAAERIIEAEPGLVLHAGMLRPAEPHHRRRWEGLVQSALTALELGGAGGAMTLPRESPGKPLLITIDPLPPGMAGLPAWRAAVLVRIVDPSAGAAPAARERWAALFGLSNAEARLAEALVSTDCDLGLAAERCGVAYSTARAQLAAIFRKTDTHGQPELVRLLTLAGG